MTCLGRVQTVRAIYTIISVLRNEETEGRLSKLPKVSELMWQSQKSYSGTKVLDCPAKCSFSLWPVVSSMHITTVAFLGVSLGG